MSGEGRPEFAVVAGPNGAGKSRLSSFYIHCDCFDGDLLALRLRREHPEWEARWYGGYVASALERAWTEAIEERRPFAFETNFSSDLVLGMMSRFCEAGYKVCLYFFGLDSVEHSKERVGQRVALGGHDVADEVIEFNFAEGQRLAADSLELFDAITFIDGNSAYGRIVAVHVKASGLHEVVNEVPEWFTRVFAEKFEDLAR